MPTRDRYSKRVDQRVDQRALRIVRAVETFAAALGAELAQAQSEMSPVEFARLVDALGFGRGKADRFMEVARHAAAPIDEMRPCGWWVLFRRPQPVPLLPGEARPLVDAVPPAEPAAYRRRVDLLSADGLIYMLTALHHHDALSAHAVASLAAWLDGTHDQAEALARLRSWRAVSAGREPDDAAMAMGIAQAQEAD